MGPRIHAMALSHLAQEGVLPLFLFRQRIVRSCAGFPSLTVYVIVYVMLVMYVMLVISSPTQPSGVRDS